jgi:5'(3')-deoxyribonucleotidase
MKNNKLVLDFDSTLCDLMSPWMDWLHREKFSSVVHALSEVETYDWISRNYGSQGNGFFHNDPEHTYSNYVLPFPDAKLFVEWAQEHFGEVVIVTHSSKKSTERAKREWGQEYLNFDNFFFFSELEDKYKFTGDGILVDDYPLHVIRHIARNNSSAVLFDYNLENGWSKMENYKDIIEEENFEPSRFRQATNYHEAKKSILELAERL